MEGLIRIPGFRFSSVSAGIRKDGRRDLSLLFSETPSTIAGLFTRNRVKAAPVLLSKERIRRGKGQAIVINSGCANACTGEAGLADARRLTRWISSALGIPEGMVFIASTGVIGVPLPMERIERKVTELVSGLTPDGFAGVSEAILTTDTHPKVCARKGRIDGKEVTVAGMAKGAGMIFPNMATMLCFLMTDALIGPRPLWEALKHGLEGSFHAITIDGDTSTNDTLLAMANGQARHRPLDRSHPDWNRFRSMIEEVMKSLALGLVRDGEGATKFIEIQVTGARKEGDARRFAFAVAHSPLVKTALFGGDVNWGRIMAAIGRAGPAFDPSKVDIRFNDLPIVRGGMGFGPEREAEAVEVLQGKEIVVRIDLHEGKGLFSAYTTDLTYDYVRINASYKT